MKISLLFYISFILLFFCWHFMMKQLSYIYNFNFAANVNKSIDKIMKFHIEKLFNSIPLSSTLDKKTPFNFSSSHEQSISQLIHLQESSRRIFVNQ